MIKSLNWSVSLQAKSARLVTLLLKRTGEIARSDISALPWIEGDEEVDHIIAYVLSNTSAHIQQRRIESATIPEWEDIVVLGPEWDD